MSTELAPVIDLTGTSALSIGGIFSAGTHPELNLTSAGAGLEMSYVHFLGDVGSPAKSGTGVGAFLHGEVLGLGTGDIHGYAALGGQINYLSFGLEAGAAEEFLGQGHADTTFAHFAPFFSVGLLWASFHIDIPLVAQGAGPTYGPGFGLEVGLQLPLFFGDRPKVEGARLRGPFGGG
jgi:hypothetical protein